jgi:hypothetical protein
MPPEPEDPISTHIEESGEPEQQTTARWEDYVDVLFSPASLFRRRAHDRVLPPTLTLAGASIVVALLLIPVSSRAFRSGSAGNPQAAEFMEQYGTIFALVGAVFSPIFILLLVLWGAVLVWAMSRLMSIEISFRQSFLIGVYAGFVLLLAQLAGGLLAMLSGPDFDIMTDGSVGVVRFIETEGMSPAVVALLRMLDVFAIWQFVLWTIGVAVIGRVSYGRAALAAGLAWIVSAVPGVVIATLTAGQTPPAAG